MTKTTTILIGVLLLLVMNNNVEAQQQCYSPSNVAYYARNSKVYLNDVALDIKGVAWFGFEGPGWTIEGLGSASADSIMDFLKANGINAIRMPFSADMVIQDRRPTGYINYQLNPDLQGLTSVQVMGVLIDKAAARGILILPDMHRFDPNNANVPLWYSIGCITNANGVCYDYTETVTTNMWIKLVNTFKNKWNVIGMDLINEPHEYNSTTNGATWGLGLSSDWNSAAIRISNAVYQQTGWTRGLTFVEGIGDMPQTDFCESRNYGHWWGGNLEQAKCAPLTGPDQTRYVYSPHIYGPSVFNQPYFTRSDYPANLRQIWQSDFGYIPGILNQPVVIGEWGGPVSGVNAVWQEAFINYLIETNIRDTFYWALNPPYDANNADTTGVLQGDWRTGNQPVLNELHRVQPSPSSITSSSSQVCVTSYANAPIVQITNVNGVAATATVTNSQTVAGSPIAVGPLRVFNNTASSYRLLPSGQFENLITGLEAGINNGMGSGSSVILLPKDNSNPNQKFAYNTATRQIVLGTSANNQALVWDLRGASTAVGTPIIVWTPNGGSNQQFNLVPVSYWVGRPVSGIRYYIINRSNSLSLDIGNENFNPNAAVGLYTRKQRYNTANQNFIFTNAGEIQVATYPNLVLDAKIDGSNQVILYSRNGGQNQQWRYNRTTEQIINQYSGAALDFNPNNNNLIVSTSNLNSATQHWYFLAFSSEF
eukprot:TRINITY_DN169_c0_g1_i1.p1 TRINITY_DN169_c0_g1~~TRINITY_DN169_c0_g1_i1.p1  ORF type:complete len:709 (+),score=199.22 TRINITY_DN169_c0_g1_i1:150-2276(+)